MFNLIKLIILVVGCVAVYGIVTGADMNHLFDNALQHITPVAKDMFYGLIDLVERQL